MVELNSEGIEEAYESMTSPFATTLATPNHNVGKTAPGTTYLSTHTVTAPAKPPASKANPRNRTSLAFHATPLPEYEKLSADSRVLSIEFMTNMPSAEQMAGIQSTKLTW